MEIIQLFVLMCGINSGHELTNCSFEATSAKPSTTYEQCSAVAQQLPGLDAKDGKKVIMAFCSKSQGA